MIGTDLILAVVIVLAVAAFLYRRAQPSAPRPPAPRKVRDPKASSPQPSTLRGPDLAGIRDADMAVAVLLIQIVRSDHAPSAAAKALILEILDDERGIATSQSFYDEAWDYTSQGGYFSQYVDKLAPLLLDRLQPNELTEIGDQLTRVAAAESAASALQKSSISRFRKVLGVR